MPSSVPHHISDVLRMIRKWNVTSFLDLGCGFGRWGFLAREMFDIFALRFTKDSWQTKIDAVEAFPDYITPMHRYIYDNIYIEKIEDFVRKHQQRYDVIFAGDVLEHLDKEIAIETIKSFIERCNIAFIVGIPLEDRWPQGALFDNPFEIHRSAWSKGDFVKLGATKIKTYKVGTRKYAVVVWCKISRWQAFKAYLARRWEKRAETLKKFCCKK